MLPDSQEKPEKTQYPAMPEDFVQTLQEIDVQAALKTAVEYFAGIGLVRLGIGRQGWQVVFANDNNPQKLEMYREYFLDANEHYSTKSVFDLGSAEVPLATLATCSFPCIDLSLAGNMNGVFNGQHSSAFWGFINILRDQNQAGIAPPLVMLENVPGLFYSNSGEDFRVTVGALNELGYFCDVILLDARRFTPQSRPRVFVIGTQYPSGTDSAIEKILTRRAALSSAGLRKAVEANPDLRWNYIDLPEPPRLKGGGLTEEVIEHIADHDRRWWSIEQVNRHLAMMDDSHRERVELLKSGDAFSYRTFYRRRRSNGQRAEVRDDDIAGCLRTAVGGSSRQFVVAAGQGQVKMRAMTPREYARLQGVPGDYPINVDENQALTGFGDAVCVPAVAWVARHAIEPLYEELLQLKPWPGAMAIRLTDLAYNDPKLKAERLLQQKSDF